ncbi:MAG TPA: ATPase, T2SS/T4P/T4SS family [Chthoniobacterales bacterium]
MSQDEALQVRTRFQAIVDFVRQHEVSDVSLLQDQVTARMDGRIIRLAEHGALGVADVQALIKALLLQSPLDPDRLRSQPGALDFTALVCGKRFRANVAKARGQLFASLRPLPDAVPEDPGQVGLPPKLVQQIVDQLHGLVLVTGPTGSGKTTTIAALVEAVNRRRQAKIITIEDPIEFEFRPCQSEIIQREVGLDTASYASGLGEALRQNPDVIVLGEIRDAATALTALQAAETGHLVLSCLHARSVVDTISRYLLLGPPERTPEMRHVLARSLRVVINQRLLRKRQGGRLAVREVLIQAPKVEAVILKGNEEELAGHLLASRDLGMIDFQTALQQVQAQLDPQEAARYRREG